MPIFSSGKSWSSQGSGPGGLFHSNKRCPPVDDCAVKNFVIDGRRVTARGKKQIAHMAALQKKARQKEKQAQADARREAKRNPPPKRGGGWPFAGSYDPAKNDKNAKGKQNTKGRARGR